MPGLQESALIGWGTISGIDCKNIGILLLIVINVLQLRGIKLHKRVGPYTKVVPLPLMNMPFIWYKP